jgi:hypothetical protein
VTRSRAPGLQGALLAAKTAGYDYVLLDGVEVATNLPEVVGVRDSKDRSGPVLAFAPDAWVAFLCGVRNGEFDLSLTRCQSRSHCRRFFLYPGISHRQPMAYSQPTSRTISVRALVGEWLCG